MSDDGYAPPSTWYFPPPSTSVPGTLGYNYNDAIYQSPGFTISPSNGASASQPSTLNGFTSTLLPAAPPPRPPTTTTTVIAHPPVILHKHRPPPPLGWSYGRGKLGPTHWSGLKNWGVCGSRNFQSPINIELNVEQEDHLDMLRWVASVDSYSTKLSPPALTNTFRIDGLRGTLRFRNEDYELSYALLHTPGEHRRMGARHFAEIQFFHTRAGSSEPALAVAAWLEPGVATPPSLRPLFAAVRAYLPTRGQARGGVRVIYTPVLPPNHVATVEFNTAQLTADFFGFASNYANYFSYYGSETQPPCREGVTWAIIKTPIRVLDTDLWALDSAQGPTARPTQDMGSRAVYDLATGLSFQTP